MRGFGELDKKEEGLKRREAMAIFENTRFDHEGCDRRVQSYF